MNIPHRKLFLVVGIDVLSFVSLWFGSLPPDVFGSVITLINGAYLGANVGQKIWVKKDD